VRKKVAGGAGSKKAIKKHRKGSHFWVEVRRQPMQLVKMGKVDSSTGQHSLEEKGWREKKAENEGRARKKKALGKKRLDPPL